VQQTPFFYLINIDKDSFVKDDGEISITMKFDLVGPFDSEEGPLDISISEEDLPGISDWYCGDTHFHTNYTENIWEMGYSINSTRAANKAMGLDWIAITDHSFDLDSYKSKWEDQTADCNVNSDNLFRVIQGEEVSCYLLSKDYLRGKPPFYQYNHLLVYGANFVPGREWEDNFELGSDYTPEEVFNNVKAQNGVIYIAHPFLDDTFRDPFEEYSLNYHGLQIWNYANVNSLLEKGKKKWVDLLLNGKHFFIDGGTDAHGEIHKFAGRVKTYIYAPGYSQTNLPPNEEILNALRYGHSVMTDGPLVVFNVTNEKDETGIIGSEISARKFALTIQWESTNEFGNVTQIYIYQGIMGNSDESIIHILSPFSLAGSTLYVPGIIPGSNLMYFRLVATTEKGFTVYTNPIWVDMNQSYSIDINTMPFYHIKSPSAAPLPPSPPPERSRPGASSPAF
jgi:hypothetical protein